MTVVPGGLVSLEYALEGLGLTKQPSNTGSLSARDADIASYIVAATAVIEELCGAVLPVSVTRRYHGGKSGILLADRIAAGAVTAVTVNGVAVTGFLVDDSSGIIYASTDGTGYFEAGVKNVAVTMTVGYTAVPETLQLAAREQVRHWWQQGKQGNRPSFGDEVTADTGYPMGFAVPNRVVELCQPYLQSGFA